MLYLSLFYVSLHLFVILANCFAPAESLILLTTALPFEEYVAILPRKSTCCYWFIEIKMKRAFIKQRCILRVKALFTSASSLKWDVSSLKAEKTKHCAQGYRWKLDGFLYLPALESLDLGSGESLSEVTHKSLATHHWAIAMPALRLWSDCNKTPFTTNYCCY